MNQSINFSKQNKKIFSILYKEGFFQIHTLFYNFTCGATFAVIDNHVHFNWPSVL